MIRKLVIGLLTLATIAYGALWAYSQNNPLTNGVETESWMLAVWMGVGELAAVFGPPFPDVQYGSLDLSGQSQPPPIFSSPILSVDKSKMFGVEHLVISLEIWVPLVVFAAYPTFAFVRGPLRRYRRRRKGWCLMCGYNLTGNVSGTCPECGTKVQQP
jgi:hypothetical protein